MAADSSKCVASMLDTGTLGLRWAESRPSGTAQARWAHCTDRPARAIELLGPFDILKAGLSRLCIILLLVHATTSATQAGSPLRGTYAQSAYRNAPSSRSHCDLRARPSEGLLESGSSGAQPRSQIYSRRPASCTQHRHRACPKAPGQAARRPTGVGGGAGRCLPSGRAATKACRRARVVSPSMCLTVNTKQIRPRHRHA